MKKPKIIVLENDPDERLFMEEAFVRTGYFEVLAMLKNGDILFEWLTENKTELPDLILSDLNMEGKNGYDVIREIKETPGYSKIPVYITSTSSTESIREKCLEMGATHYLVKPDTFINYEPFVHELYKAFQNHTAAKH